VKGFPGLRDDISVIRTPDQRLRVFVSSTLKELAEERAAAQKAITNLHLTPVMFELGARPYPSGALYRAYLEQSQIFIGIYWQQYGWVAADMEISGIEDEYILAKDIPKLIYLKSPAPEIKPGLKTMIRNIQSDNTVSYKRFSEPEELQELIENDLALLLSEQFYAVEMITQQKGLPLQVTAEQKPEAVVKSNLPLQPTQFIGRQRELTEICNLLMEDEVRLLTLTGPGGTGKTRLGLEAAHKLLTQFNFGTVFVPLADLSDPELVISKTAQILGIREGGQPLLDSLKLYLVDKELLILFDNFEQIIAGADVVAELLAINPRLKVLVTSRIVLHLQGEFEYPVPPLNLPNQCEKLTLEIADQSEAMQLFASRAKASNPKFKLNENNVLAVSQICNQLDGLPLAIELAAVRIKLMPPEVILDRLSQRLRFLTGGARDLPARQQTLRNTLDWSYSLLDPDVQVLFTRLGVFVGGFSLAAVETICGPGGIKGEDSDSALDVVDGLEVLLDNSLLLTDGSAVLQPRFRMLDTIQDYALEHLTGSGELEALKDQHAYYYSSRSTEISIVKTQTSEAEFWLDWVETEHDNLRAALAWCIESPKLMDTGPLLLNSLIWFWFRRGYLSEGREWAKRMLALPVAERRTQERVLSLFASAALAMWQGDLKVALSTIDKALVIARWLETPYNLAVILLFKGTTMVNMGRDRDALPLLEESLVLFDELAMPWYSATTKVHMGNAVLGMGNTELAFEYLESAWIVSQELEEKWLISFVLNNYGEVSRVKGDYDRAQDYYRRSEELLREMGDIGELARLVHNLGSVALQKGELEQAKEHFNESLAMFKKLGNQRGIAESLAAFAGVCTQEGKYEISAQLLGSADALLNKTGGSWWPADRMDMERNREISRNNLDREAFESAWEVGQGMELSTVFELVETIK
jgi:predicted ATPase